MGAWGAGVPTELINSSKAQAGTGQRDGPRDPLWGGLPHPRGAGDGGKMRVAPCSGGRAVSMDSVWSHFLIPFTLLDPVLHSECFLWEYSPGGGLGCLGACAKGPLAAAC